MLEDAVAAGEWKMLCPFTPRLNPSAKELDAQTRAWLWQCGLICDPERDKRFMRARFGALAAGAYPFAHPAGLQLAADWTTWLFYRDDMCDEAGFADDPAMMREHNETLLRVIMEGPRGGDAADPLIYALVDLRERMIALGGHRWLASFCTPLERYFSACAWEAENRLMKRVPDSRTYIRMRRDTGAVLTCTALIEITDFIAIDPFDARSPELAALVEMANDVICWSNDIFSAPKEMREGDTHNLCIILKNELACDLASAIRCVIRMHNMRVEEFQRASMRLRPRSPGARHFVLVLEAWMRANYDWSLASGRYPQLLEDAVVA